MEIRKEVYKLELVWPDAASFSSSNKPRLVATVKETKMPSSFHWETIEVLTEFDLGTVEIINEELIFKPIHARKVKETRR